MIADADLQVWLDTQSTASQTVMIPYVKSVNDIEINYRMELVQQAGGSTSRVSQQGQMAAAAAQPTAVARIAVGQQKGGECRIELVLRNNSNNKELGIYRFECPR
jgi:outer membrane usher protein FimD/PapC